MPELEIRTEINKSKKSTTTENAKNDNLLPIYDILQPKSRFRLDILPTEKVKIGSNFGSGISLDFRGLWISQDLSEPVEIWTFTMFVYAKLVKYFGLGDRRIILSWILVVN